MKRKPKEAFRFNLRAVFYSLISKYGKFRGIKPGFLELSKTQGLNYAITASRYVYFTL